MVALTETLVLELAPIGPPLPHIIMKQEEHIPLSEHTTFKLGGTARYFFRVKTLDEVREAVDFARQNSLPFFVLGGGSNLLVSDKGFAGVVIKNEMFGLSFKEEGDDVFVTAGAGENWDNFVATVVNKGLYGLENLSGIPGTVGAAPVQNIGAYGVEVKDSVVWVEALDVRTGGVKSFTAVECGFGYRDSFFKTSEGKNYIITAVTFRLKKNGISNLSYKDLKSYFLSGTKSPTIHEVRTAVLEIRRGKFPDLKTTGTAGSFFKNPIIPQAQFDELKKRFPSLPSFPFTRSNLVKVPLAWILDNILHLKGFMNGPVGLHEAQPLVLVHTGGGRAENVSLLARDVVSKLKVATGIEVS